MRATASPTVHAGRPIGSTPGPTNPGAKAASAWGADAARVRRRLLARLPRQLHNLTPRLLSSQLWSEWSLETSSSVWRTYARTQSWQVLQSPPR